MSHSALRREFSESDRSRRAGRAAGRRVHLHRGADLASARSISAVLRHAGRRAPPLRRARRRARGDAAVEQMQRHDLRRQSRARGLRARDIEPHSRARRPARNPRVAFRRQGAQQPERRVRALRRLDLFLRSLVRAHAGLRRRAAAPARLPGRLPRAARRRRAAAPGRSQSVRAAERALLLARRAAALCQRHGACTDPRLRRQCRRLARPGSDFRLRHPLRTGAGRARRHEMRQRRQYLGDGARRHMGLRALGARCSAKCGFPNLSPICTGANPIGARSS